MDIEQIQRGVFEGVEKWSQMARLRGREIHLSRPAVDMLVTIIANIERDRSPSWDVQGDQYLDSVQAYVLSILPNIFADMEHSYRWRSRDRATVTSWEILHNISGTLEKWCPIPKDI